MSNQLAIREDMDIGSIATHFVKSGYFQDVGDVSKAIVKILAGRELGFGPFASMASIDVIQGKPSPGADLMASSVKASPRYDYRIRKLNEAACEIEFFERNGDKWDSLGISTFTADDARKAGTKNMERYPRNMLFARAMSNGVRWYCPDVFGTAVYTPEELGAPATEPADIIQGSFTEVKPESEPKPEPPKMQPVAPKTNGGNFNPVFHLVEIGVCENNPAASGLLNHHVPNNVKTDKDALTKWGKIYRGWRDMGSPIEAAAQNATEGIEPVS